jgi:heme/copper-type cytochrome/quinol oxidase subunit 2
MKFPGYVAQKISLEFSNWEVSILKTIPAFATKFDAVYSFRVANEIFVFEKIEFKSNEMILIYSTITSRSSNEVTAVYSINIPDATFTLNHVTLHVIGKYWHWRAQIQNFNDFPHIPGFHEPSHVEMCVRKI